MPRSRQPTGTARQPSAAITATAGVAAATGTALHPAFIYVPAGLAAATGTAQQRAAVTGSSRHSAAFLVFFP